MEMESAVHSVWEIVVTLTKCIEHKNSHGVIQKSERQHPFTTDVLAAVLDLQAAQGCRLVSITILAMLQLIWVFIIPPMAGDVADVIPQQTPDPLVSVAVRWIQQQNLYSVTGCVVHTCRCFFQKVNRERSSRWLAIITFRYLYNLK